ncbi:MAG TPA: APC family permease [Acidisarcina sp.]|nr:APC family permease [Acidisarcina sp.]
MPQHTPAKFAAPARGGKLRLLPLVAATYFMVSGGPYGIEDILGGAGYQRALVILLLLPFFWSLPTALMIGELASAVPAEGGFYVWVRRALGPFWGFQEAWLSLAASVFDMAIYPTLFVLYLGKLAPTWTAGSRGTLWGLLVVVACSLWNLRGARAVGDGAVVLCVLLLSPFAVLVGMGFWKGIHGASVWHQQPASAALSTAILVAMWNYMGWDNASTVAQEVEDPQRNYPRAMLMSAAAVALTYLLPLAAVAAAGIPPDRFSTGSWADAAATIAGPWLAIAIVAGGLINGFGMFNALMLSYTRLPLAMAEDGMLPRWLGMQNRRSVPVAAILVCAVGWALALGFSFERLISIDLILYGGSLLLEFVALIALRVREPELHRPFSAGSFPVACLLGVMPAVLLLFAVYSARGERMAHMPALVFALLVACGGPLGYWAARTRQRRQPVSGSPPLE